MHRVGAQRNHMLLFPLLQEARLSIAASRLRTFLAMLGIVIGVGSVILMLAIGAGSRQVVENKIRQLGTNLLIIRPATNSQLASSRIQSFTLQDASAIGQLPSLVAAAPTTMNRPFQVAAGQVTWNAQVT